MVNEISTRSFYLGFYIYNMIYRYMIFLSHKLSFCEEYFSFEIWIFFYIFIHALNNTEFMIQYIQMLVISSLLFFHNLALTCTVDSVLVLSVTMVTKTLVPPNCVNAVTVFTNPGAKLHTFIHIYRTKKRIAFLM